MATDTERISKAANDRIDKAAEHSKKLAKDLEELRAENVDLKIGLNRLFGMFDEILEGQRRLRDLFEYTEMKFKQTEIYFKELDKGNVENYFWLKDSLNKYLKENKLPTINEFLQNQELGELTKEKGK